MEKLKPILIIDDKQVIEQFSSKELLLQLTPEQSALIDFQETSEGLWKFNINEDDFVFFSKQLFSYKYIFLHDSYDNPALKHPVLLIEKLAPNTKVILFSGNRSESLNPNDFNNYIPQFKYEQNRNHPHFEIRRSIYFRNLKSFVDNYLKYGDFMMEALYDSNYNHKKNIATSLIQVIFSALEKSEFEAANTPEFNKYFELAGYTNEEIEAIKKNYSKMNYKEFMDAINDELKTL